jgi:hypothetical protein
MNTDLPKLALLLTAEIPLQPDGRKDGAEADDRVHLAHAGTNDKATLKRFADQDAAVVADRTVRRGIAGNRDEIPAFQNQ